MSCLDMKPSAPDQLNQLGDLKSFFDTAFGYVASAGKAVANNSGAIVNIIDAAGRLKAQTAAAQIAIRNAATNARTATPAGMTPQQWEAYQRGGANQPPGFQAMPSWVLPVALGAGALVLVMVMTSKRGSGGGNG